jgi:hypothetical protein
VIPAPPKDRFSAKEALKSSFLLRRPSKASGKPSSSNDSCSSQPAVSWYLREIGEAGFVECIPTFTRPKWIPWKLMFKVKVCVLVNRKLSIEEIDMAERKSSMPGKGSGEKQGAGLGEGLGQALGGLSEALGGAVGGLGKTVGGVAKTATGLLQGALGQLLGPLQQLQQKARSGDPEAAESYDKAVSMVRESSEKGNQDADALLKELGEALGESGSEEEQKPS